MKYFEKKGFEYNELLISGELVKALDGAVRIFTRATTYKASARSLALKAFTTPQERGDNDFIVNWPISTNGFQTIADEHKTILLSRNISGWTQANGSVDCNGRRLFFSRYNLFASRPLNANSSRQFQAHSSYNSNTSVIDLPQKTEDSQNHCESKVNSSVEKVESSPQSHFFRVQRAKESADERMSASKLTWADVARRGTG